MPPSLSSHSKNTYGISYCTSQKKVPSYNYILPYCRSYTNDFLRAKGYFPRLPWGIFVRINNNNFWFTELHRRRDELQKQLAKKREHNKHDDRCHWFFHELLTSLAAGGTKTLPISQRTPLLVLMPALTIVALPILTVVPSVEYGVEE